jgi:hypothetical protein
VTIFPIKGTELTSYDMIVRLQSAPTMPMESLEPLHIQEDTASQSASNLGVRTKDDENVGNFSNKPCLEHLDDLR